MDTKQNYEQQLYSILTTDKINNTIIIDKSGLLKNTIVEFPPKNTKNTKIIFLKTNNSLYRNTNIKHEVYDINLVDFVDKNPDLVRKYNIYDYYKYCDFLTNFYKKHKTFYYASKITDNIIVGSGLYCTIRNKDMAKGFFELIENEKINTIINVSVEQVAYYEDYKNENVDIYHYPISETKYDINIFNNAVDKLDKEISLGKKVYIHCEMGYNRSPSVVLCYFVKYLKMIILDAYKLLRSKRNCCLSDELVTEIYKYVELNNDNSLSSLKIIRDIQNIGTTHGFFNIQGLDLVI